MSLIEYRTHARIDCFHVKLHQGFEPEWQFPKQDERPATAVILDISSDGCCAILGKKVSLEETKALEISVNSKALVLRVETRWQDLGYATDCKRVGLRFVDHPQELYDFITDIRGIADDASNGFLIGQIKPGHKTCR